MTTTKDESGEQLIPTKKKQGFAAWSPEKLSEVSRRGGKAAHIAGTAHEFSSEEAKVAGRKGALASHASVRARMDKTP
jgi:general stress protein YciG